MAGKCIDKSKNYELININTSDKYINKIANKYIQDRNLNINQSTGFNCLINFIAENITVNPENIKELKFYFNIYIELCSIANMLPDITNYSYFVNIPYDTVKDWLAGKNRSTTHTPTLKKMRDFCKANCVTEAGRGNVGAIYVSKALYGLTDQKPPQSLTQNNLYINAPVTRDEIAAEFGALLSDNSKN